MMETIFHLEHNFVAGMLKTQAFRIYSACLYRRLYNYKGVF